MLGWGIRQRTGQRPLLLALNLAFVDTRSRPLADVDERQQSGDPSAMRLVWADVGRSWGCAVTSRASRKGQRLRTRLDREPAGHESDVHRRGLVDGNEENAQRQPRLDVLPALQLNAAAPARAGGKKCDDAGMQIAPE